MPPVVQVLMSTYNGQYYIEQQLTSIQAQGGVEVHLLVRDDGSNDGTIPILHRWSEGHSIRMTVVCGNNMGVIGSFLELVQCSDKRADYFAFSDQDDVWKPDKLKRAVAKLSEIPSNVPAVYFSRTEIVDEKLRTIGFWPPIPSKPPGIRNALVENIAVGCTMVMNRAARDLVVSRVPDTSRLIMHDWWVYLVVSAFGKPVYDDYAGIFYRQHGRNATGADKGFLHKWFRKAQSFIKNNRKKLLRRQAEEFVRMYGKELPDDARAFTDAFLHSSATMSQRVRFVYGNMVYRQNRSENVLVKLLYLAGKI